jgi:REP element-mobilizing transposase RayT
VSRLRRIADSHRIFFVTTKIVRDRPRLAAVERDALLAIIANHQRAESLWLFGYAVMPDHLHLLLLPRNQGLASLMHQIKADAAGRILRARKMRGPLWQPRYFDNIIRRVKDF